MFGEQFGTILLKIVSGLGAAFLSVVMIGATVLPLDVTAAAPRQSGASEWTI